ncbi:hypothetical protein NBRC10513v2_002121 [Rhodotorula toruloides]|uniref:DUF202 domain-containing protein n=1 Tax=Rhodotorula toruloides TaxID=5286 RepID=A0A2T0AIF3_RHOTO|nr:hypothetical protein AAT19DRAFT_8854 [Rhodotorula toruloides]
MPTATATHSTRTHPPPTPDEDAPSSIESQERRPFSEKLWGRLIIPNDGSTARDYLARERNFLSWIKLSSTLAVLSAALLIRFQFGSQVQLPEWEQKAQVPLGILFFIACIASLVIGTTTFYRSQSGYAQHKAFVYAGKFTDLLIVGIGLLTLAACILLLAAKA